MIAVPAPGALVVSREESRSIQWRSKLNKKGRVFDGYQSDRIYHHSLHDSHHIHINPQNSVSAALLYLDKTFIAIIPSKIPNNNNNDIVSKA